MTRPEVSIVVPAYNHARPLPPALDSLLAHVTLLAPPRWPGALPRRYATALVYPVGRLTDAQGQVVTSIQAPEFERPRMIYHRGLPFGAGRIVAPGCAAARPGGQRARTGSVRPTVRR